MGAGQPAELGSAAGSHRQTEGAGNHGRLKGWMRRFNGVATAYLENYLGWFRALDRTPRSPRQPSQLLTLAIGA